MKKRNSGAALTVVMCVMLVVVALSLALLRSAAMLVQLPLHDSQREQCRINAVSVSEVVTEEIEAFLYDEAEEAGTSADPDGSLKDLLAMAAAGGWDAGEWLRYQLQTERLPGETWVSFCVSDDWEGEERLVLYMEAGSTVGEESCTVISRFVPIYHENDNAATLDDDGMDAAGEEPAEDRAETGELAAEETEGAGGTVWSWKYLGREWGKEEP